jgi:uroporphyrin-III C-methyltransferase
LRQTLAETEATSAKREQWLQELESSLASLTSQVESPDTSLEANLVLARVAYLLDIADAALQLERDVPTALGALAAGAELLAVRGDAAYRSLETALREDHQALTAVAQPDVANLALQWAQADEMIDTLAWRELSAAPAPIADEPALAGWQGVAIAIWRDLKRLIEVREITPTDQALLDPGRAPVIKDRLRTELASLRLAVYHRDNANARASAARTASLLTSYFVVDDPNVAQLLKALDEIATLELSPPLPELATSHAALDYARRSVGGAQLSAPPRADPTF